jgi:hypothetical protein
MKGTFLNLTLMALVITLVFFNKGAMASEEELKKYIFDSQPDEEKGNATAKALEQILVRRENKNLNSRNMVPGTSTSCSDCAKGTITFVLYQMIWIGMILWSKEKCIFEKGEWIPESTDVEGIKSGGHYPYNYKGGDYSETTCYELKYGAIFILLLQIFLCWCIAKSKGG